jgi:A/G-specific adenine glycosylase
MPRRRVATPPEPTSAQHHREPPRPSPSTATAEPPAPPDPLREPAVLPAAEIQRIRAALLAWYRRGHRDLPWRRTRDPYAIWISEIMLQQTRVDTVKAYFRRFMSELPTVQALAAASEEVVLTLWSGLGYYSRARNLHAAAGEIVERYGGEFPRQAEAVRSLPGIGPYTAGAIRSIAFGQQAAILDGNVIRVLSRLRALGEPVDSAAGKRLYWSLAEALVPPAQPPASREEEPAQNDPGDFNQALMELGATVCLPQRPVCLVCPLSELCAARRLGDPEAFPPKKAARAVPVVEVVTLVLRQAERVLLCRRPSLGLWGGLWEPPTLAHQPDEDPRAALARLGSELFGIELAAERAAELAPFVHVLSHREMRFRPYLIDAERADLAIGPEGPQPRQGYTASRLIPVGEPVALGLASWVSALLRRIAG